METLKALEGHTWKEAFDLFGIKLRKNCNKKPIKISSKFNEMVTKEIKKAQKEAIKKGYIG